MGKFSVRNLRCFEHSRGVAWSCDILLDGVSVGICENNGNGGCNDYRFDDSRYLRQFMDSVGATDAMSIACEQSLACDELIEQLLEESGENDY